MQAVWNGAVLADSNDTIVVEGNQYFPPSSVNMNYMTPGNEKYTCPWKGETSYYNVTVDGKVNENAAWYYPKPYEKAAQLGIKDYVAFWKGVKVI